MMSHEQQENEEKRNSIRLDLEAERVLINWRDSEGVDQEDYAICMDLARNGLLFDYTIPFDIGELITVTFNPNSDKKNSVIGQVCRCNTRSAVSFYIALQLMQKR
jgi:hypothetical protein